VKQVGIAGLPDAGTQMIFTALTSVEGSARSRTHQAVVPVPDERVEVLGRLHGSRKLAYTQLSFTEVSGMVRRGARGAGSLPDELLGHLRGSDALLLVLRGFDSGEPPDPARDLADLELELVYADLEVVSGKLERDAKAAKAGDAEAKRLLAALERAKAVLDAGAPVRSERWEEAERAGLQALSLLTLKPVVVAVNTAEGTDVPLPNGALAVAAQLEAEVAGLSPEEAAELLASYGQTTRALDQVIRAVYRQLDLITFLTAGEKEAHAWEVRRGATAPEAAGVIHSDFQRGFIRAEVIAYEDLVAAGSWNAAKAAGLVRQEGKAYEMQEGDVVEFRFAV
jgi:hypothetical protein